jgi:hypothetical protein
MVIAEFSIDILIAFGLTLLTLMLLNWYFRRKIADSYIACILSDDKGQAETGHMPDNNRQTESHA